jgi:hypothetical protein
MDVRLGWRPDATGGRDRRKEESMTNMKQIRGPAEALTDQVLP